MENLFPMVSRWIEFARTRKNLIIEIRTKSSFFHSIKDMKPSKSIILSWTLSPEEICKEYEIGAPPLLKRLNAVSDALDKGWRVRLCFDPILLINNWETIYNQFIDDVFSQIKTDKLRDVTIGVFRMNKDYFNRIRKRESKSALYYKNYVIEEGIVTLEKSERQEALNKIERKIGHYLPEDKILMWS